MLTTDTPTTKINWKHTWDEVIELWEEIIKGDLKGMRNELCDVYTNAMCAITTSTGIPMPIFWMRSANGWFDRMKFFKIYLNELGLEFKVEYLRYGANYKKDFKRRKVVELAVEDQIKSKVK
jgi:hypothetical protein